MLHNVHPCAGKYCSKSWGCRFHYQAPHDRRPGYIGFSLFPERHFLLLSNNSSWQPRHAELGEIPAGNQFQSRGRTGHIFRYIIERLFKRADFINASASKMARQLSLHVTIQVAPHNVDAFLEALRPCWAGCVAEEENLFFDVFQDPETPGRFHFVELWSKDKEWFFEVQFKKPYYKPYLDITIPMWIADRKSCGVCQCLRGVC
jgi:quinol monooxygenase YgiN